MQDEVNHFQLDHLATSPKTQASQAFVDGAHQDLCPAA
jgi:hypothetical protein